MIARELRAIPQTLDTVPGIGPVTAAGIISEIGDVSRFQSQAALAMAPVPARAARPGETSLAKAYNAYLRYYLVEAANSLRLHNEEYSAYYRKKYSEVPKHQHKRALVLTARKFTRLVFALLSKGQIHRT